jgi:glycosyltransferase involved in cell wall biosynthesis
MVVPTYNDFKSLSIFLNLIEEQKSSRIIYLIVNNGSTDSGIEELLNEDSKYWKCKKLKVNLGFGGGILEGIKAAETNWIGWMPGNLKIKPADVEKLVAGLNLKSGTFIKCHRLRNSKSAKLKTFVAGFIQSVLTKSNLFDTGGTPTICERNFILPLTNLPTDFVFESRILFEARNNNLYIERPWIPYGERVYGSSHWQKGLRSELSLMRKIWVSARTWKNV